MKRRVLICGASGFIGRNVAESLIKRNDLELYGTYLNSPPLKNPGIKMSRADLTNKEDIERIIPGIDVIIQAAAVTTGAKDIVTRPYLHVTDNAVMNSLILRAVYEHNVSHSLFFS